MTFRPVPKPKRPKRKRVVVSPAQRARLLKRAEGRCERCKELPDFRGLMIHHKELRKMGGSQRIYEDTDLEVLCGVCHDLEHGIIDK